LGRLLHIGDCYLSEDVHAADKYVWHFTTLLVGPAFSLMDLGVHWQEPDFYFERKAELFAALCGHAEIVPAQSIDQRRGLT
jgi:hypothetical protein